MRYIEKDIVRFVIVMLAMVLSENSEAEAWRSECVGRIELRLPGQAEVAGYSPRRLASEIEVRVGQQQFEFIDGQKAEWSELSYTGTVYVSNLVSAVEYNQLFDKVKDRRDVNRLAARDNRRSDGGVLSFAGVGIGSKVGMAWHVSELYTAFLLIKDHVFFWSVDGGTEEEMRNSTLMAGIIKGINYRGAHEVPKGPGVCFPYIFIRDDGRSHRRIVMTFRLKEHPDVTIVVEDANFFGSAIDKRYKKATLAAELDDFWSQYEGSGSITKIKEKWKNGLTTYVKFGDTDGVSSFVNLVREDKTVDFGYLLKGRVATPEGEHQLRLQIIRDAARAKQRGVEPVKEADFLKMVYEIADSVQYRN